MPVLTSKRAKQLADAVIPGDGWSKLMSEGCIEYLDVEEEDQYTIAFFSKDVQTETPGYYTHCEIHPAVQLGVLSNMSPFITNNPSPRATYQTAMAKQSIGFPTTSFRERFDNSMHVLWYTAKLSSTQRC